MKVATTVILAGSLLLAGITLPGGVRAQSAVPLVKTVVLDPGHGGKDPGACSGQYREKDIVLKVAGYLGALLEKHYPDVKVIHTRKTDVLIDLYERGNIANKAGADLFISIHVDAAQSRSATGTSTYVMGVAKEQANLEQAMRENDVITYESDYSTKYEGYEPGSAESFIIFSLMQYAYREQSLAFADLVQRQYARQLPLGNRGVKQAGFLVLWKTACPAVLTEMGFITNPNDVRFVGSASGQKEFARSLFNAFSAYKVKTEGRGIPIVLASYDAAAGATDAEAAAEPAPQATERTAPEAAATKENGTKPTSGVRYRVQVAGSTVRLDARSRQFGPYRGKVEERKIGRMYKYFVGSETSYTKALALQKEVRKVVKDAFLVAFDGDRQITVSEARRLQAAR